MPKRKLNKTNFVILQDFAFGTIAISSLFLLFNASGANATTSSVDSVSIEVPVACTMTSTVNTAHTATANVGTYQENIGETTFNVICNDANGFSVYAVGYTNDEFGNTTMKPSAIADTNAIATGTATSGNVSNWAMKLTVVTGDYAPTLETGFNAYHVVPAEYTKVASYSSNTDSSSGSSFKSTYAAFVASAQPADTYTGKVKYTVVHPANAATPITPAATMQNMDASVCTTTPKQVIDDRDEHIYTIQRLADGNCWMMENLDLGRTDLTTDLTSVNTNLSTTVSASTFNGWKKTASSNAYTAGEFILADGTDATSGNAYGTLYNYYTASAGTISGSDNRNNAEYDICPAGWRLPTGDQAGEYPALYAKYNSLSLMRASVADSGAAFALPGIFYYYGSGGSGSINSQDYLGFYWSSTAIGPGGRYVLMIQGNSISAASGYGNSSGASMRCILDESMPISELTYMQDFNGLTPGQRASVLNSMAYNTTYSLLDNRDNRTYEIAKLKDGNIWMAENLDLGRTDINVDLTSANTNINSNTTIPATYINSWKNHTIVGAWNSPDLLPITTSNASDYRDTDSTSGTPYGTLYNYCAATFICERMDYNFSDATSDICPAGWRLPTGGATGEFQALYNLTDYNTLAKMRAPIASGGAAFALAGYIISYDPDLQGIAGYYWSSTKLDRSTMYKLTINSDVKPADSNLRNYSYSIRCIAKS